MPPGEPDQPLSQRLAAATLKANWALDQRHRLGEQAFLKAVSNAEMTDTFGANYQAPKDDMFAVDSQFTTEHHHHYQPPPAQQGNGLARTLLPLALGLGGLALGGYATYQATKGKEPTPPVVVTPPPAPPAPQPQPVPAPAPKSKTQYQFGFGN